MNLVMGIGLLAIGFVVGVCFAAWRIAILYEADNGEQDRASRSR